MAVLQVMICSVILSSLIIAIENSLFMCGCFIIKVWILFQDKARTFLLREKEFMSEISGGSDDKEDMSTDDKISAYESLLMDCKEAIEVITEII